MENLTKDEIDFVVDSLNASWNQAHEMLTQINGLGDIQKKNLEYQKKKSKEIMTKLGVF